MTAEKAWKKSRKALIMKIGEQNIKDPALWLPQAKAMFDTMDGDKNCKIDKNELAEAMQKLGLTLKSGEIQEMMTEADEDGCASRASAVLFLPPGPHAPENEARTHSRA